MNDSELLSIFWVEVNEYLQALNGGLLQIEMTSRDDAAAYHAILREMNRVAHSMKGAARAVGIGLIEKISHCMEEVFNAAQNETLQITPDTADTLYDGLDLIQNIANGDENDPEATEAVLERLDKLAKSKLAPDTTSDSRQMLAVHPDEDDDVDFDDGDDAPDGASPAFSRRAPEELKPSLKPAAKKPAKSAPAKPVPAKQPAPAKPASPPVPVPAMTTQFAAMEGATVMLRSVEETIRVTVSKLDRLMAEATELFVARMHGEEQERAIEALRRINSRWQREWRSVRTVYIRLVRRLQDQQHALGSELPILLKFLETNQRYLFETNRQLVQLAQSVAGYNTHLSTLTDQLQDEIGGMRLLPFESIAGGFQRMVRDMARDMDKQIQLDIVGGGVEIDKTVLEALKDPLIHLLRNAIDHGIESPEVRVNSGKSPLGRIEVAVEQRGSEIVIRVADDGRGIDVAKVRRSIVKKRLLSETEAAALSEDEVRSYIFHSGLSTSDRVTEVSGRGLGMDIVRERVESLRGRVTLYSMASQGTITTLSVPVSLTRIRCVLLRVGQQNFAVPSAMVVRMNELFRDDVFTAEGRDMVLVNERPTPLTSLGAILDIPSASVEEKSRVLILQASNRIVAFEVDELLSEQELVLKPLGPELANAPYIAGAALLGAGDVILVLDANDLVRGATGAAMPRRRMPVVAPAIVQRRTRVLVVDDSITTRTLEKNILETAGFEVHVAMNGVEAWKMLEETEYDVVISDVEMPRMNGLELTARIKSSSLFRHIPVILLTSLSKPEQREAGLHAGAEAYLVKSRFDQGELLQTIQSLV